MPQTIKSLTGFIGKISAVKPASDEVLLYRGHSNRLRFKLWPSVMRKAKYRKAEPTILRDLVASQPSEFASDLSALEQLARVQHYSLPTRLLDVTWNPLVALFFAVKEHPKIAGEVVVFRIKKNQVKYFDSDTVSCVANLAHLDKSEKDAIDFSLIGDAFQKQPPVDRLLHFIRAEKSHFRPLIDPQDLKRVFCVKPKQNNRRIIAQNGAFLLFGLTQDLISTPAPGITVEHILINKNSKKGILNDLDRMNINDSTMFPEIDRAAIYIRRNL